MPHLAKTSEIPGLPATLHWPRLRLSLDGPQPMIPPVEMTRLRAQLPVELVAEGSCFFSHIHFLEARARNGANQQHDPAPEPRHIGDIAPPLYGPQDALGNLVG
jgi:hypothetical protein